MTLVERAVINYMLLEQWHILNRVHVKILIIGQDDDNVWSFIVFQSNLLNGIDG